MLRVERRAGEWRTKSVFGAFVSTCAFARRDGVPAAHVSQPTCFGSEEKH